MYIDVRKFHHFTSAALGCLPLATEFLRATACNAIARLCYGRGVLLSVCLSVCHTAVLCQNDATDDHEIFTV